MDQAIKREKELKKWKREWKNKLIMSENPELIDFAEGWFDKERIDEISKMDKEDLY